MPRCLSRIRAIATATVLMLGTLPANGLGQAQSAGFVAGTRTLFDLDLPAATVGEVPAGIKVQKGNLDVVVKDGAKMLKAPNVSEFLVTLSEFLPADFTLEFDIVPKGCCNPEDLAVEGTRWMNQGVESARIQWDSDGQLIVVGGGPMYQAPMPEDFKATLPGVLTQVAMSFSEGTISIYTNGRRLTTLTDRRFPRGKLLRVQLGGQDDGAQAIHLARFRVGTNSPPVTIAAGGFVPGTRTLFELDMKPDSLGHFPRQLKAIKGPMAVVMKDGVKMLRASNVSEFLVSFAKPLPPDFTIEMEVIPKECCNPHDLSFEGTPTSNQGVNSADIQWDSDGQLMVIGGGEMYQSPMPEALAVVVPGVLTQVNASLDGGTIKLYTNGRRLYTLTDRRFVRDRVLRFFLGGQDGAGYAVHLARLRIATNSPP